MCVLAQTLISYEESAEGFRLRHEDRGEAPNHGLVHVRASFLDERLHDFEVTLRGSGNQRSGAVVHGLVHVHGTALDDGLHHRGVAVLKREGGREGG